MTPAEAQMLLAVAASVDNRKPDKDVAMTWSKALSGLPFVDCRDAIVRHYQTSSEWLMPAHIVVEVRRIRSKRIAEAGDLCPPAGLTGAEERAWLREARRIIGDGQPLPEDTSRILSPRHLPDLRQLMPRSDS